MAEEHGTMPEYFAFLSAQLEEKTNNRIHMLKIGMKSQTSALATAAMLADITRESLRMCTLHSQVGQLTKKSHGLVIETLIRESTDLTAQLIAISHLMIEE